MCNAFDYASKLNKKIETILRTENITISL
jgi:hypothetical protein